VCAEILYLSILFQAGVRLFSNRQNDGKMGTPVPITKPVIRLTQLGAAEPVGEEMGREK